MSLTDPTLIADTTRCARCGESREDHEVLNVSSWEKYELCPKAWEQVNDLFEQVYDEPEDPRTVC